MPLHTVFRWPFRCPSLAGISAIITREKCSHPWLITGAAKCLCKQRPQKPSISPPAHLAGPLHHHVNVDLIRLHFFSLSSRSENFRWPIAQFSCRFLVYCFCVHFFRFSILEAMPTNGLAVSHHSLVGTYSECWPTAGAQLEFNEQPPMVGRFFGQSLLSRGSSGSRSLPKS